jgi:hypothetical protein
MSISVARAGKNLRPWRRQFFLEVRAKKRLQFPDDLHVCYAAGAESFFATFADRLVRAK